MASQQRQQYSIVVSSRSARPSSFFILLLLLLNLSLVVLSLASISEAAANPTLGLVALYRFDGNVQDTSGKAMHAQLTNASYVIWEQGRFGKALRLPYGNAYAKVPASTPVNSLSTKFTISVWIKPQFGTQNTLGCIVSTKTAWNAKAGFELCYHNGQKTFTFTGSGNTIASWGVSLLQNSWYYVTVSVDGPNVVLWINNQSKGAKAITPVVAGSIAALTIGMRSGAPAASANSNWYGSIEDLRFYDRALTAEDRQALMNNPYAVTPVSPSRSPSRKATPSKSKSRNAAATPSKSKSKSKSKASPSRTKSKTKSKSRTPSRSKTRQVGSASRTPSRKSPSRTRSKTRTRSRSRSRTPSRTPSRSRIPLDNGLIGRWRFEQNGADSSPGTLGGAMQLHGAPAYVPGKFGYGIHLTGDNYGTVPATTSAGAIHDITDKFTISIWVYPQFPAENQLDLRIVSKKEGWDSTSGWECNYNQGAQFFDFLGSGNVMAGWNGVLLENNRWYHIALVINNGLVTFYLDGVNQGAMAADPIVPNNIPLTLGRIGGDPFAANTFWLGMLDDLRIYNRILTPTEISNLGKNPYPSPQLTPSRTMTPGGPKPTSSPYPSPKPFTIPEMDVRFVDTQKLGGFDFPLGVEVAPDGRVVIWQKSGKVYWVVPSTGTMKLMIDFTGENVGDVGDHGLLSLALHPNFASNRWIYFYYTVSPGPGRNNMDVWIWSRVVRYKVAADDTLNITSQQILIGNTAADGIPGCSSTHTAGTLKFGHDGMLYVSHGDGARFEFVDFGNDEQCGGLFGAEQNIGAFRSQSLNTMAGKILRINPENGRGLTDNPFYQAGLSLDTPRSKVYALGLRNPFRMNIRPPSPYDNGNSVFYVNDVGWNLWEELNVMKRGSNAGWPCYEGPNLNPSYANEPMCQNLVGTLTPPLMAWHHTDASLSKPPGLLGQAGTGVAFYTGTSYPTEYQWAANGGVYCFFWCDYAQNWVKAGFVDAHDNLLGYTNFFSTAAPVFLGSHPDLWGGDIHYVTAYQGTVRAISHPTEVVPVVEIASDPILSWGLPPATVQFSSDGTYDPYGRPLQFHWTFGDGATSTLANPKHTYTTQGNFTVTCRVTSPDGSTTKVLVGNTLRARPTIRITKPADHATYVLNDMIQFTANRSPGTTIFWDLQLMHESHFHPQTDYSSENSPIFQMVADTELDTGERYSWRMVATATDNIGNWASDKISLYGTHTTVNDPPNVVLTPVKYGRTKIALTFDGTASVDPDGDLLEFNWDWGDGTGLRQTQSIGITRHIYDQPGTYNVNVTVWETFGKTSTVILPVTIHDSSMLGYWMMDDVGPNVEDSSGNGCPGTLLNGVIRVDGVAGGRAIQLIPAQQQYMKVTGNVEFNGLQDQMTISVWVYPTLPNDNTVNTWIRILSKKMFWDAASGYELQYNPSVPALSFIGSGPKNTYAWVTLPLDTWSHIVVVADQAVCSIYLNGVEVTDPTQKAIDPITPNIMDLSVGKFGGDLSAFFAGRIDELQIYSAAMTPQQVAALYQSYQ